VPALVGFACANAGGSDAPADAAWTGSTCPPNELATEIGADGQVECSAIDGSTRTALHDRCSVYAGWLDGCDGCASPPAKWGRAGATSCMNGAGADNTCTEPMLGAEAVQLFGLNFDGNVDGNDKLYGSLHCSTPAGGGGTAPCKPGEYVTGIAGTSWTCAPLATAVVDYVRASCSLYLGWQDGCGGCANPPVKWGFAADGRCMNGAGADNTCAVTSLGGESVQLFGLSFDGDVDDNDKLHVGLSCSDGSTAGSSAMTTCPAGQFVAGTLADGGLVCESPAFAIGQYFKSHCSLYFGWSDNCDGCMTPPAKWGHVRVGSCTSGAGGNTCGSFALGAASVDMLGIATGGDVDGNDAVYVGFRCP
jgi:hypothetical protein